MGKAFPGYKNKLYHVEYKDGIRAVKLFTYITANEGFAKRTFNYVFYMLMAIFAAPFLGRADVVISTSPQFFNGMAGYVVSRLKRAPWLLEIRDLWPESIIAVGAIDNPRIIRFLEGIEAFLYRKANHIVSVTQSFTRHIKAHGGQNTPISVIRNGADISFFKPQDADPTFSAEVGANGKFVASYVGTHGMAHGLHILLDAAEKLRSRPDILLLTAGEGANFEALKSQARQRKLDNLVMLGQRPKTDMPKLWAISDASLVLLKKQDLFKTVIPSKIFESMAMSTPIILGVEGESADIISEAETGLCIDPENPDALVQAILELADNKDTYNTLAGNGREYVATHFDRNRLAEQYLGILEELS
jgi:glycosyltransferase involved in cell wall biosynthesis